MPRSESREAGVDGAVALVNVGTDESVDPMNLKDPIGASSSPTRAWGFNLTMDDSNITARPIGPASSSELSAAKDLIETLPRRLRVLRKGLAALAQPAGEIWRAFFVERLLPSLWVKADKTVVEGNSLAYEIFRREAVMGQQKL